MSLLSKLTIVIPSYNRHKYILRNLHFWSGSEITVHILDGSMDRIPQDKLSDLDSNVHYHHLPIPVLERIAQAGNYVDTEYAALLGDDEFFLHQGLLACIEKLEVNKNLISCMGRCILFDVSPSGIKGDIRYPEMKDYAIFQDDSVDRMIAHMNPYTCSTIYSIVRTPIWKRATEILGKKRFSDPGTSELQFELAVCYFGKSQVLPVLTWLRSDENPAFDKRNEVPFYKWWKDKESEQDRKELLRIMGDALYDGKSNSYEEIISGVEKAFDAFVLWNVTRIHAAKNDAYYLKQIISKILPEFLLIRIQKTYRVLKNRNIQKESKTLIQAAKELQTSGVSVDFGQLSKINDLVVEFHRNETQIS